LVFVAGSTCLGLELVGAVNQGALGAPIPIIAGATAFGLMVSAIWAAYVGQTYVAAAFGVFCGFWISYTILVLCSLNGWLGLAARAAAPSRRARAATISSWSAVECCS